MCEQVGGNRGIKADYCVWVKVAPITKGTESSVPVVSDRGLEHYHPTMSMLRGHGDRSKIKIKNMFITSPYFSSINILKKRIPFCLT